MPTRSNKVFNFGGTIGLSPTSVSVKSTYGLTDGVEIEILRSSKYQGKYSISNITDTSFNIDIEFDGDESNSAWQVSRQRPVLVNPGEGETIDTLRQGVNQISGDLGNKENLSSFITNKKTLVDAINSLESVNDDLELKNFLRTIAIS